MRYAARGWGTGPGQGRAGEASRRGGNAPAAFVPKSGGNAASLKDIYEVAVAEGLLVRVTNDIYLHSDVAADMHSRLKNKLAGGAGATVAEIRDLLGTTRKYAVPLCEYLDRIGLTRRAGDLRYWQGT